MPLAVCSGLGGTDSSRFFDLVGISSPSPCGILQCCYSMTLMVSVLSSDMNLHLLMRVLMWILTEWILSSGSWQMSERISLQ